MTRRSSASVKAGGTRDGPYPAGDTKTSKRRCVQSACVPCRRRKSKCDGGLPDCATCTAVYKTECHYDAENESRRSKSGPSSTNPGTGTKRDASSVSTSAYENSSSAESILKSIQRLADDQVSELVRHIRKNKQLDLASIAETWRKTVPLPTSTVLEIRNLREDLSEILGKTPFILQHGVDNLGHLFSKGFDQEVDNIGATQAHGDSVVQKLNQPTWTTITNDLGLVEKLFSLYFTWSHSLHVLFSREIFFRDFRTGKGLHCSSLLVNAICAYGCHFTDDSITRTDPPDFRTAGTRFFAEARRLLFEDERTSLTTIQALCIMSMREFSAGRHSSGSNYIGRCIRMCVELGLHLHPDIRLASDRTKREQLSREVTFLGCYAVETFWSICSGRVSQLPPAAITLAIPAAEHNNSIGEFWGLYHLSPRANMSYILFLEFSSFSELVNENIHKFLASREGLTSANIISIYSKYQRWYHQLPSVVNIDGKNAPEAQVLVLHMLYHTIIINLFRPMLHTDRTKSNTRPRDICIDAANNISSLIRTYRSFSDLHLAHLAIPYILFTICIVHLLCIDDHHASPKNLVEGLRGLEDLHHCHPFAAKAFGIIYTLAKMWDLPWPEEMNDSILAPDIQNIKIEHIPGPISDTVDPFLAAAHAATIYTDRVASNVPYVPTGHTHTKEGLPAYGQRHPLVISQPTTSRPGIHIASQHYQLPIVNHASQPTTYNPVSMPSYEYPQSSHSTPINITSRNIHPSTDGPEAGTWSTVHSIPHHASADTALHLVGSVERLGRDGFEYSEPWLATHINGYNPGAAGHAYAARNDQIGLSYLRKDSGRYEPNPEVAYQQPSHPTHQPHGQEVYSPTWWAHANNDNN